MILGNVAMEVVDRRCSSEPRCKCRMLNMFLMPASRQKSCDPELSACVGVQNCSDC